jgi:hypothetical protein
MGQTQFRSDDTVKWWLGFGDGSDGDYSSTGNATDAPVDSSCSGTAGSTSLTATNTSFAANKPVLIHQTRGTGAGTWELNQIDSYVAGTITLKKALQNTYTDSGASQAQVIQLKQYNSFTLNSGHTLTAKAWNGNVGGLVAFLCKGTVTIAGTISCSGKGFVGGQPGASNNTNGYSGEGTANASRNSTSANGNGGGGGNDLAQAAGGGSNGTQGGGNNPGSTSGNAGLTLFPFGGGGGGGGRNADAVPGAGGAGGGGCLIIANDITVSGAITLRGNNGQNGGGGFSAGGGAGGGGGSCLLKGRTIDLGTNKVTAPGGTGGTKTSTHGENGGSGGSGRIHADYAVSISGTTSPALDSTQDTTIKATGGGGGIMPTKTKIFYPNPVNSVDGNRRATWGHDFQNSTANWTHMRNATTSYYGAPSATNQYACNISAPNSEGYNNIWYQMGRGVFLFDTTTLPKKAEIVSAQIELYVSEKLTDIPISGICITSANPASNTDLVSEDYAIARFGSTAFSTLTMANITAGQYNSWKLNAAGISNITKKGISKFGVRTKNDVDNSQPTWVQGKAGGIMVNFSEAGSNIPRLVIKYKPPSSSMFLMF